jgi:hypothetical protein
MARSRQRRAVSNSCTGLITQCPAPSSRSRANNEGLSKRGQHSQSMEPSRLTSAAAWQSEINA